MRTTVSCRELEIQHGAYEMTGTYGHILYHRGDDPDRRVCGVPVKVTWSNQVQYRCSFVLEIVAEIEAGRWTARLRGATFELALGDDGALSGAATFPDGTAGTIYLGREMGFGRRPVLVAAKSQPDADGNYQSKTFAGEVAMRTAMQAEVLRDPSDPDLTAPSPAARPMPAVTELGPRA